MNNISIFETMHPDYKIDKPIRLIELFAGVGSQAMALRNLVADFEHYKVVEFDKYAIASYNAIHGTAFETMDITKVKGEDLEIVNTDSFTYLLTYSFPCQDLSVAGKMQGMTKGDNTRSGLLWEVERLLNEVENLPQVLLMENVPQVVGKANIDDFHLWQRFLEDKGYSNYTENLNAKDYGVAQNRNRTFMVSILGEYSYNFPQRIKLEKTMKDYLEDEVDEKFYIDNEKASQLIEQLVDRDLLGNSCIGNINPSGNGMNGNVFSVESESPTLTTNKGEGLKIVENIIIGGMQKNQAVKKDGISTTLTSAMGTGGGYVPMIMQDSIRLGGLYDEDDRKHQAGAVWDKECLSPTIDTMQGGNRQPMIVQKVGDRGTSNYSVKEISNTIPANPMSDRGQLLLEPKIVASRGRNKINPSDRTPGAEVEQRLEPNSQGICNTITSVQKDNLVLEPAILTPKRTEYGKAIRKDYESGKIEESRHNMTELQPRNDGICNTLTTVQKDNYVLEPTTKKEILGSIYTGASEKFQHGIMKNTSKCLKAEKHDTGIIERNTVAIKQATEQGYIECKIGGVADLSFPTSKLRRGRVQGGGDISPTLTTGGNAIHKIESQYRIRKLSPLECWRLMGFTDEDFYKAEKVNSNSQLYRQSGNSIVVQVLEAIFKQMEDSE